MSDRFTKTDLEKAKEATKRIKDERAQKRMKNSRPEKKGSSITDIFKSYGKYDGKPIELKGGGMSAGQQKIAAKAPPPNKIDEKDFAVLRAEKAKGRGMGLQDEKVQPGKVMKAKRGHFSKSNVSGHKRVMGVFPKVSSGAGGKGSGTGGRDTRTITEKGQFIKRRKELAGVTQALKATRIGKIALGVGAAGVAAQQYLKSKMKKKKELEGDIKGSTAPYKVKKKMGGGMMQKPMGYKTGGGYDSGTPGKLRDLSSKFNKDGVTFKNFKNSRVKGTDQSPRLKKLIKKREALGTAKSVLKTLSSVASPVTAAGSAAYKLAKKMKDKDRFTKRDVETAKSLVGMGSKNRPIKKDHSSRNPNPKTPQMMGGGMMQKPMGYSKGTMVKARGCKLGRTKPTKIT